jgi:predicted GIY-YIG superfamily endonuclease
MSCGTDLHSTAQRMIPNLPKRTPVVYFLRLRSGMLYIGASVDLEQRLADHGAGHACRTTHLDAPVAVLRVEVFATFAQARTREAQIKRWSRAKKEALLCGNLHMLRILSRSRERPEKIRGVP